MKCRFGLRSLLCAVLAGCAAVLAPPLDNGSAWAQQSSGDVPTHVTPPALPTEVSVGAYLIGLSRISEPSDPFPTYDVEVFLNLSWEDPRLAFEGEGSHPHVFQEEAAAEKLSEIWSPDLEIENEVEQRQTESFELTILPDGTVDYEERFGATLNADLDLRRFPFDRQVLDIELQSFTWDRSELSFAANEAQTGFDADFKTPEWNVTGVEYLIGVRTEVRDENEFAAYTFRIHARRYAGHFLLRIFVPLFFVMSLTWAAFWEPTQDRIRIGFIALLTVVATHTVISRNLPRLNYPTSADVLLIVCYIVATTMGVVSIVVQRMETNGAVERAQRIDRWARWLVPLVAATVLGISVLLLWT